MSSPSRHVIDPLICSYSETAERRPPTTFSASANNAHAPGGKPLATQPSAPSSSWTPLVSRTFTGEFGSLNSTPSSRLFSSICKQGGPGQPPQQQPDTDFGLNLTPFLTHNMNLLANPPSAGNLAVAGTFTPYYDKTMHMADFFMDSPIRQTPGKPGSVTPSRFDVADDPPRLHGALSVKRPAAAHQPKRPVAQLDTPARHAAKKPAVPPRPYDGADSATPLKRNVLRPTPAAALNKTPLQPGKSLFLTPAPACAVSSPSTVIMSSAVKTPAPAHTGKPVPPPSPTPLKDTRPGAAPVMGIFSERRPAARRPAEAAPGERRPGKKPGASGKFQIVFTDVHTLMNSKKKKKKGAGGAAKDSRPERKKGRVQARPPGAGAGSVGLDPACGPLFQGASSFSMPQDYNTSMGSSRDLSMMHHSTASSGAGNMSGADHASFDLMHGGLVSTPNGKYLLDTLFERPSPGVVHAMSAQRLVDMPLGDALEKQQQQAEMHGTREFMPPPKAFSLQQAAQAAQAAQRQDKAQYEAHAHAPQFAPLHHRPQQASLGMNVLMSTPQHQSVMHGTMAAYALEEPSPSDKESMRFLYDQLHVHPPAKSPRQPLAFAGDSPVGTGKGSLATGPARKHAKQRPRPKKR